MKLGYYGRTIGIRYTKYVILNVQTGFQNMLVKIKNLSEKFHIAHLTVYIVHLSHVIGTGTTYPSGTFRGNHKN
jgi:hypothetical protein